MSDSSTCKSTRPTIHRLGTSHWRFAGLHTRSSKPFGKLFIKQITRLLASNRGFIGAFLNDDPRRRDDTHQSTFGIMIQYVFKFDNYIYLQISTTKLSMNWC